MLRRCAQICLTCPHRICNLFDALVVPILSYRREVWFWDDRVEHGPQCRLRPWMLTSAQAPGVHQHVHTLIALVEFGRYPLSVYGQRQVDRFRQRLRSPELRFEREPLRSL